MGPQRSPGVIVSIGRGDKIRTCDPLHPMDSRAERDATRCYGFHRLIFQKAPTPMFIGFPWSKASSTTHNRSLCIMAVELNRFAVGRDSDVIIFLADAHASLE